MAMNEYLVHPWRRLQIILGAIALVAVVFYPALSGGFIFDDYPIFVENNVYHVDHWDWAALQGIWSWSMANVHRPLAMLTYALNYATGGSIWGFKATNLAIHLLNAVLLASLATCLLRTGWRPRHGDDSASHAKRGAVWGLMLATAWALHPLQVSTVMYVVQRMELLGFTFTLLALLCYWHARQLQLRGGRAWPWLLGMLPLIGVGYLTKETIVLVPGYTLLLELTLLHFGASQPAPRRNWKWLYTAGCIAAVAVFAFYLLPHYVIGSHIFDGRPYTAWERELTQLRALTMYIGWSVLPIPSQMHFYYDNYPVSTGWLSPVSTLACGLFLLGVLVAAVAIRRRRPLFALGIGWFFVAHAITSAPLPLELVFEHRNYPALFGILLAFADLVWLATRRTHPRLPAILAAVFVASLGFFTVLRAATWGNPLQLGMTLVHDNPTSPRASYDLARLYMDLSHGNMQSPLFTRAMQELERGAALPGSSPLPEQALLLTASAEGIAAQQAWWDSLVHKLKTRPLGPQEYRALQGLGTQAVKGEARLDPQRLNEAYQTLIDRRPDFAPIRVQYADIASVGMNDKPLAIRQLERAIELNKGDADYTRQLVAYLLANNRVQEATALAWFAEQRYPGLASQPGWRALQEQLDTMSKDVKP